MSKPFKQLLKKMPAARRERIKIKTELLKNEIALRELGQALTLAQEELANSLHVSHAAASKYKQQSDIYINALRKILFAMGAELKIVAQFPDGEVLINQFDDIHHKTEIHRKALAS